MSAATRLHYDWWHRASNPASVSPSWGRTASNTARPFLGSGATQVIMSRFDPEDLRECRVYSHPQDLGEEERTWLSDPYHTRN